jgi:immune inhibitor A
MDTPLLSETPRSGQCAWWSNQADESLTTLTRRFDLSEVEQATLTYWTWYDIEPHFDYAVVEVSADGGQDWHILSTPSGTGIDPYPTSRLSAERESIDS